MRQLLSNPQRPKPKAFLEVTPRSVWPPNCQVPPASCRYLIIHFKNHPARRDVFPRMWSSLSAPSLQHVSHPCTTPNVHMAHIWSFIHQRSGKWGGYLMRETHREIWRACLLTVPLSCCWQRLWRNKCVPDPTGLIFSLTPNIVSVPTFGFVKWNQKAAYCQPGISILQQQTCTNNSRQNVFFIG